MDKPLILDRYRPLEKRGQGGFGTVEIAFDTRIQRRVAIKRIPLSKDYTPDTPGLAEARTAALLANPNIVQVFDFAVENDEALIIMECIDGPTLSELIELEGGMFDVDEAACITQSLTNALSFAHENQVLHLDVKPDNVLIAPDGTVKLTDFGVAELAEVDGFAQASGGTIGYMPPEQIRGEHLDERSDEWGLASTVYEMLTGENPFIAGSTQKSLDKIENGDIATPSSYRSDLQPEMDGVLLDALSPSMDIRYDTVEEFGNALLLYLGDPEVGRTALRNEVNPSEEAEEETSHVGLWDRIGLKGRKYISRVFCAICCGWLGWLASSAGSFPQSIMYTIICGAALAGFLAPQLGSILVIIAIVVGLIACNALWLALGFGILGAIWWLLFGRKSIVDATLPLTAPLFSAIFLAPLYPLTDGFFTHLRQTVPAVIFGAVLSIMTCCLTGAPNILSCGIMPPKESLVMDSFVTLSTSWNTWIIMIGWVFAGVLMAALCSHGTKVLSIVGSALGCVVMLAFTAVADFVTEGYVWSMPPMTTLLMVGLAFIIMCIITAMGSPYHGEGDIEKE